MEISKPAAILLAIASVVVLAEGAYLYYVQTRPQINTCRYMISEWEKAEPTAAAAKEVHAGPIATVNFAASKFANDAQAQESIAKAVSAGPNFAGHFVIAEMSCGENCQTHAIVDVVTGAIVATGIPSKGGIQFSKESNLIMTNPASKIPPLSLLVQQNFAEKLFWFGVPREYYALSENNGRVTVHHLCVENAYDGQF